MKSSTALLHFKKNWEGFVSLQSQAVPTLNPHPFTGELVKSLFHCKKEPLTTLIHRMTCIDIKSNINYFSAVFIPFSEDFIVPFGMRETGALI